MTNSVWCPQRESNPYCRLERAMSQLADDGDAKKKYMPDAADFRANGAILGFHLFCFPPVQSGLKCIVSSALSYARAINSAHEINSGTSAQSPLNCDNVLGNVSGVKLT